MEHNRPRKQRRRSRWEPVDEKQAEQRELQARLDRITRSIQTNTIPVNELCRSPSPEPRYDNRGKRVNTRYDRALEKLDMQRHKICTRLKELDPSFRPPRGMRPPKFTEKLYIPKEKEGTVNYIGLILGPRGNTQKRLEKDFNCKVAIRGKGSVKDGRARGPSQPEDDEQLHVIITAEGHDARERIAKCKLRILDITKPRLDDDNDHKQAQLRELAQLNGTLRGQDGGYRPSNRNGGDRGTDAIVCSVCGDPSHPTTDCPKRGDTKEGEEMDAEYKSFIAEVNGVAPLYAGAKKPSGPSRYNEDGPHRGPPQNRVTPPWLLPGAFATSAPVPPPPETPGLLPPGSQMAPQNHGAYSRSNDYRGYHREMPPPAGMGPPGSMPQHYGHGSYQQHGRGMGPSHGFNGPPPPPPQHESWQQYDPTPGYRNKPEYDSYDRPYSYGSGVGMPPPAPPGPPTMAGDNYGPPPPPPSDGIPPPPPPDSAPPPPPPDSPPPPPPPPPAQPAN